ncbi:MAG: flavodoxin-dependent (E)-4-hydroxy-3-methylbut-2-enyl-diphosphate synthase [Clostridiaceae bacterium]|nr:flavodoxin-dependent (E)-4-hydroxy-3-methylbut-2-enyl-diphosphate synthase [Clostridiaceae bacterium]
MDFTRKDTKKLWLNDVAIGGNAPIVVQSMNNTDTRDVEATLTQIENLAAAGCEVTRVAVPDSIAANALRDIVERSPIPVIADIHFQATLALQALENGVAGLRINPGNIGSEQGVKEIAIKALEKRIPIRVGVNSGSLDSEIRDKMGGVNPDSMVASVLKSCKMLEQYDFHDICISIKASDPKLTIDSYRKLAQEVDYPLHLGVTEAGTPKDGIVRSAVGIGTLLAEGIGDTIRVSLTADPILEVETAYSILKSLGLRSKGALLISCPTCGRTEVDLQILAEQVEPLLTKIEEPIKVAVMGCPVNGPGEAREADCGIAGGRNIYLIFRNGEVVEKVNQENALSALKREIEIARKKYLHEQQN